MAERILLIEEEETVASIIDINLRVEGFEVNAVRDGESGISRAREGDFDLIICDVEMRDMDAFELCRKLKSEESIKHLPLILLTTRRDVENKVEGLHAGADDFITKPFEFSELLTRINLNLDRAAEKYELDELTGLPGNVTADDALKEAVLSDGKFVLMRMQIKGLRPYRLVYGDDNFERVIRFLSDTIKKVIKKQGSSKDMAAYHGAGAFSILTIPERAEIFSRSIIRLFDAGIRDFYSAGDLERGSTVTFDRRGNVVENPIMTVSIGGATNAHRKIQSHWEASDIAKEVLEHAMTFEGSRFFMDRRKD